MKPIPESWHKFHRLVDLYFNDADISLTKCVQMSKCSARMPRIYLSLGWITPRPEINRWFLPVSSRLTLEMAEQIRAESKRMENVSDPLGLNKPLAKPTGPTLPSEKLNELAWKDTTKSIILFTDAELVSELRRRGVDVKAQKLVEL